MRTHKSFLISAIIILIIALLYTSTLATDDSDISKTGARVEIVANEAQKVSAAGARVNLTGSVAKDTWLAGALVEIDLQSSGDLYAVGAEIILRGNINGSAKLAAAKIDIDSSVKRELEAMAAEIKVSKQSVIGPYSSLNAALIDFNGIAQNNLELKADEIIFAGVSNGDLTIQARTLNIADNAVINGDLLVHSIVKPVIATSANISGQTVHTAMTEEEFATLNDPEETLISNFGGKIIIGTSAFLLGLILILFTRNTTDQMTGLLRAHPGMSILWGLGIFFGLPIIIFASLVSVIGIPFGLSSLLLYPFLILLGFTAAILALSDYILSKSGQPRELKPRILFLIVSVFIYYAISLIPVFGGLVVFVAMLFGLGAIAVTLGNRIKGEKNLPHNPVSL